MLALLDIILYNIYIYILLLSVLSLHLLTFVNNNYYNFLKMADCYDNVMAVLSPCHFIVYSFMFPFSTYMTVTQWMGACKGFTSDPWPHVKNGGLGCMLRRVQYALRQEHMSRRRLICS